MSDVIGVSAAWIKSTLDNAVGVSDRVYFDVAPQDTSFPLAIYQYQSGTDTMVVNAHRVFSDMAWIVKAVDRETSLATLRNVAGSIDAALHRASGTADGGTVLYCTREAPFQLTEEIDGIIYRHLGGVYRIVAK